MINPARVVIVGDIEDPHVYAVVKLMPHAGVVVLDSTLVSDVVRHLSGDATMLTDLQGDTCWITGDTVVRGWLRRLAPAGSDHGITLGSRHSAMLASRLTLLAGVIRDPAITWLTPVDALFAAENKIVQYRTAAAEGIRVPKFLVNDDPQVLANELAEPFVLKPLGPANFVDDHGQNLVVFVKPLWSNDLNDVDMRQAPFLAQQKLDARLHLRVVTCGKDAWVAQLNPTGLPTDWRRRESAHRSFVSTDDWPRVEDAATRLAARLHVGFSSQDWIIDADGPAFVDLNPGGQWLFLPEDVSAPVTARLARWLTTAS